MNSNRQAGRADGTEDSVRAGILAYLTAHPEAQDTARGIAEWWLPQAGLRSGVRATEQALARLVREGWVSEWVAADGRRHYRLHASRRPDQGVAREGHAANRRGEN